MIILLTATFMFANTKNVSAKVTFNKTSKSITKGKNYTIKISGVKSKNIKKVKLKYNKKIIKVKKLRKNKYRITGKKKGKTTLKATVKYLLLDYTPAVKTIKCKINVKNKAAKKKKTNNKKNNDSEENIKPEINWGENNIDKLIAQIEQSKTYKGTLYKLNDYTVFNKGEDGGEDQYGLITSPFYSTIDWYSKKDYDKIINEVKLIVKESKITDDMIDEEKAYRIGRYIGIDCDFVCSYDNQNKSGHAWNNVKLGDYYYVTDLTGAYFTRNVYGGVSNFFREYSNIGEENIKYMDKYYKMDEYTEKHQIDEVDYYTRCKNEGKVYLKQKELYNLPE